MTIIDTGPTRLGTPLGRPLTLAVAGAGARGAAYADLAARRPDSCTVVAVAEPRERARRSFAERHRIDPARVFESWRDLAEAPRIADAVVVALLDEQHVEAALAFIERGYDLLLEKPMATTEEGCRRISEAAERAGVAVQVCHVMRHTTYTRALKAELARDAIGEIISVEHLEPVGYYHFAHSFVRGNWRRQDETSFVLLTKSCHDLDWLNHVISRAPRRVASFGSLTHFRAENRPPGAAGRCLDCAVESNCPFSAARLYRTGLREGGTKQYFTNVMTGGVLTEDAVTEALATGPYGRCVYACDNDVADHQVVSIEYDGGVTASFTLSAFTPLENRHTKIFGTRGQLTGDGRFLEIYDFRTERTTVIDTSRDGSSAAEGHAGGDQALMDDFIDALTAGRPDRITAHLQDTLDGHRLVFAAEQSRREGRVVQVRTQSPANQARTQPGG